MKIVEKRNKKGQLTQQQLVLIILSVLGFIILLYFLGMLPIKPVASTQMCHLSVVARSTSIAGMEAGKIFPLRCKTKEVEIKTADKLEIEKKLADEMRECWSMLGEGKLDFLTGGPFGEKGMCMICSIITFDKAVQKKTPKISASEFYNYLNTATIPEKQMSYLQYFTESEVPPFAPASLPEMPTLEQTLNTTSPINTTEQQAVLFIMGKKGWWERPALGFTAAVAGAKIGIIAGPYGAIGGAIGGFFLGFLGAEWFDDATLVAGYEMRTHKKLDEAQKKKLIDEAKNGFFTTLLLVPYDAKTIRQYCTSLSSIP